MPKFRGRAFRLGGALSGLDVEPGGLDVEPGKSKLLGTACVLGAGLDPRGRLAGCHIRRSACDVWRRRLSPTFEGVERSGRIAARTSPNELDDLLKVARPELSYNVGDTPLMEQVDSRYYRLRHILNGGSSHCRTVKKHAESIGHAAIYRPSELPTRLF